MISRSPTKIFGNKSLSPTIRFKQTLRTQQQSPLADSLISHLTTKPTTMCIIYFASHAYCTHRHLLGAFACGLNCPTNQRHTFHLDDNGHLCETCIFLCDAILDPDVIPVQYNPPLFGKDEPVEWEEDERKKERHKRRMNMKAVPDAWMKEKEGWNEWGVKKGTQQGGNNLVAYETG